MKNSKTIIFLTSIFIVIVIGIFIYWKLSQREYSYVVERVTFQNTMPVTVNIESSKKKYYGARHGFGFGGGGRRYKMSFSFYGNNYSWENVCRPILLNSFENKVYLVVFDDFNPGKIIFRFYKYNDNWIEIEPEEFPKNIAIPNILLSKNNGLLNGKVIDETMMYKELNPDYLPFRDSLAAKLWVLLEKNIQYYDAPDSVDKEFLLIFKKKYISKLCRAKSETG